MPGWGMLIAHVFRKSHSEQNMTIDSYVFDLSMTKILKIVSNGENGIKIMENAAYQHFLLST